MTNTDIQATIHVAFGKFIIPPKIENLKCHAKVIIKGADNNNIEGERKNDKL